MSKKSSTKCSVSRILKAPIRALVKVRDFYIKGMWQYGGKISYGQDALPRSYSVGSAISSHSEDDLRELIRVASTRSLSNKVRSDNACRTQQAGRQCPNGKATNNMARSQSVGIGRIDEDKACEFEEYRVKVRNDHVFARSRSLLREMLPFSK